MLAELGSAAETALKVEASVPKIAVAIRPRRPVEGDEVFMVVSWIFDERRSDLPDGGGRWEGSTSAPRGSPSWVFKHGRNAMRPKAAVHETGPKVGERG